MTGFGNSKISKSCFNCVKHSTNNGSHFCGIGENKYPISDYPYEGENCVAWSSQIPWKGVEENVRSSIPVKATGFSSVSGLDDSEKKIVEAADKYFQQPSTSPLETPSPIYVEPEEPQVLTPVEEDKRVELNRVLQYITEELADPKVTNKSSLLKIQRKIQSQRFTEEDYERFVEKDHPEPEAPKEINKIVSSTTKVYLAIFALCALSTGALLYLLTAIMHI